MNAELQSIIAIAIIAVTVLVFAVKTALRIRRHRQNPDSADCGGGSCGCSAKFKPPVK